MNIYSDLGGSAAPVDPGLTEAEALLEAKKVSGYLGLLSAYYFGGAGTVTSITPANVNQWVDVNLTVDPAGTFDYRPQDMVDADAAGFSGAGLAASVANIFYFGGTLDGAQTSGFFEYDMGADAPGYVIRFGKVFGTAGLWNIIIYVDGVLTANQQIIFDGSGPAAGQPTSVSDGVLEFDVSGVVLDAANSVSLTGTNEQAGDPFLFSLAGMTQQAFGKMRVTGLYNPDIDESQLECRLLFTPNSSGAFGQFSIAEQAATMTQGAGVDYFVEPTITFFVGNTIEDLGAGDAGQFQLQIRSSVEGDFTLRGMTCYYHS